MDREDPLEKEMAMATNSSILAWRIPWTEEPGGLQTMAWVTCTFDHANAFEVYPQRRVWLVCLFSQGM